MMYELRELDLYYFIFKTVYLYFGFIDVKMQHLY